MYYVFTILYTIKPVVFRTHSSTTNNGYNEPLQHSWMSQIDTGHFYLHLYI